MTVLEAMACGKPVLAFHQAGLKEIITDGYDGFTIPAGDIEMFCSRIVQMVDEPKMTSRMGACARNTVRQKYATEMMVTRYLKLYKRVGHADLSS